MDSESAVRRFSFALNGPERAVYDTLGALLQPAVLYEVSRRLHHNGAMRDRRLRQAVRDAAEEYRAAGGLIGDGWAARSKGRQAALIQAHSAPTDSPGASDDVKEYVDDRLVGRNPVPAARIHLVRAAKEAVERGVGAGPGTEVIFRQEYRIRQRRAELLSDTVVRATGIGMRNTRNALSEGRFALRDALAEAAKQTKHRLKAANGRLYSVADAVSSVERHAVHTAVILGIARARGMERQQGVRLLHREIEAAVSESAKKLRSGQSYIWKVLQLAHRQGISAGDEVYLRTRSGTYPENDTVTLRMEDMREEAKRSDMRLRSGHTRLGLAKVAAVAGIHPCVPPSVAARVGLALAGRDPRGNQDVETLRQAMARQGETTV